MSAFEQELHDAFDKSEKIESTAREVENRIRSIEGASALLPKRPYGTPVNGASMGLTLKHLINAKDRQLAAYLNIADGHFKRVEEEETVRQEVIARMKEKTEELAYQNQMRNQQRQKDLLWNQTHNVSQHRIIR